MTTPGAKDRADSAIAATSADARSIAAARHLAVPADTGGQRLDNFLLSRLKGVPKTMVYRLIRTGQVRVNGSRKSADCRLEAGDDVRIPPIRLGADAGAGPRAAPPLKAGELPIVHEDEQLIVVDKPAGLAVHGGSGIAAGLIERLRAARPGAPFLELAHRLDRETSGLLIVAKKRQALLAIQRQMASGGLEKHYRALVAGRWGSAGPRRLAFPLRRLETATGDRRVCVDPNGQASETIVRPIRHQAVAAGGGFPAWFSLLDCELVTGRTHQIRVHLAHAGFPIVGDEKYGDFTLNKLLDKTGHKRMFLHAYSIRFQHPASLVDLRFESAEPDAFAALLRSAEASEQADTLI